MDEFRFVLRCFAFAALLLVVSQLKTKHGTVESDIHAALVNSKTAEFVNKAADGGVRLMRDGAEYLRAKINSEKSAAKAKETAAGVAIPENKKAALLKAASQNTVINTEDESVEEFE